MSEETHSTTLELLTREQIRQLSTRQKLRRILKAIIRDDIDEDRVDRALAALEGAEPEEQNCGPDWPATGC